MRRRTKPLLLIGSPECTAFSTWQYLSEVKFADIDKLKRERIRAELHLDFVTSLYKEQIEDGLDFLHEHPRWASSWRVPSMEALKMIDGVELVQGDQCQYGAEVKRGKQTGSPILKPTGFLSNSPKILEALSRRCSGRHGEVLKTGRGPSRHA